MAPTEKEKGDPSGTNAVPEQEPTEFENALALHRKGQLAEAQQLYQQVLARQPEHSDALHLLGIIAAQTKDLQRAVDLISRAIEIDPDNAAFHFNRGVALHNLGRLDEALSSYDHALTIDPDHAEAHNNRGVTMQDLKRFDEALESYEQAIRLKPDYVEAYGNRGNALKELKRFEEALASYEQVLKLAPDDAEAHNNHGNVLKQLRRFDDALSSYERALKIRPDYAEAHNNRGNALKELGNIDGALASYERALKIRPDYAEGHWNLSLSLLKKGNFERGWEEYEWRLKNENLKNRGRSISQWLWSGNEPLDGKSVLLYQEQGLGDEIMFASMIPDAMVNAGHVSVVCDARLKGILARSFPEATILGRGEAEPLGVERRYLIASLGRLFRSRKEDFHGNPYLIADPPRVLAARKQLDHLGPERKIGIMWRRGVGGDNEKVRSVVLADMAAAMDPKFHWVSLNHLKTAGEEVAAFTAMTGIKVHHWPEILQSADYDDTAALLSALDAVFTVTCTIGHCCGALGTPVHVLVPRVSEWRYGVEGSTIPWYRSMTMYRQAEDGSWPLERVRAALARSGNGDTQVLERPTTVRRPAQERDPNDPATWGRVSRNAPCPCGSGRKYKHCHGKIA